MEELIFKLFDGSLTIGVLAVIAYLFYRQNEKKDKLILELHKDNISILEKLNVSLTNVIEHDMKSQQSIRELKSQIEDLKELLSKNLDKINNKFGTVHNT